MDRYPHELSGGMKQRVMIAQALAANPELLIADEPTTALDGIQARILDLLVELQERHRAAVLYISHDLSLVRRISDRVAVMYAGRLVEAGSDRADLRAAIAHPYTRGLLGAIRPDHTRGRLAAIEGTVPGSSSRRPRAGSAVDALPPRSVSASIPHCVSTPGKRGRVLPVRGSDRRRRRPSEMPTRATAT